MASKTSKRNFRSFSFPAPNQGGSFLSFCDMRQKDAEHVPKETEKEFEERKACCGSLETKKGEGIRLARTLESKKTSTSTSSRLFFFFFFLRPSKKKQQQQCVICLRCRGGDGRTSYHCSAECLRAHWPFHKELHEAKAARAANGKFFFSRGSKQQQQQAKSAFSFLLSFHSHTLPFFFFFSLSPPFTFYI